MNNVSLRISLLGLAALMLLASSGTAVAGEAKTLCVFDLSGANGDAFASMKEYQVAAAGWGVDFELKPYTDELAATEDFKAGKCDAALITGVRARPFNKFTSTIEAMGALPEYGNLKKVVKAFSKAKARKLMIQGDYEVAGIFPLGAVYLYVNDKSINTKEALAGKKIATFSFDEAARVMVDVAGASYAAADISTFAGMFNNGSVDACYAPAAAYGPLELHKGLGSNGGVIKFPLAMLTLQLVIRTGDSWPEGFQDASRAYAYDHFNDLVKLAKKAEKAIPGKYWIEIKDEDRARYEELFRDVRVRLRDKEKVFDKSMLKLMRKIRCKADATRAECSQERE